jgi:microcystin-dependent protein
MGLETAAYISDLVSANPTPTDGVSQADDHLRTIKSVLQATFPNMTGPMTASQSVLSGIDARVTALETDAAGHIDEDGSVAMAANLDLGVTNKIVNLANPSLDQDAATKAYVDQEITTLGASSTAALQAVYPVGSVYMNADNGTNPGTLFGFGTWVAFGQGRVPVGVGTGTDDNALQRAFAASETGGVYKHSLAVAEMPAHKHLLPLRARLLDATSYNTWRTSFGYESVSGAGNAFEKYTNQYDNRAEPYTESLGSGTAHENVQAYVTVYMWKRTA